MLAEYSRESYGVLFAGNIDLKSCHPFIIDNNDRMNYVTKWLIRFKGSMPDSDGRAVHGAVECGQKS